MYSYHSKEFYFAKEELIADWFDSLCSMRSSYWIFCWKLSILIRQKWKQQFPVYRQTLLHTSGCVQWVMENPCMKLLQIFTLRCRTKSRSQSFTSESGKLSILKRHLAEEYRQQVEPHYQSLNTQSIDILRKYSNSAEILINVIQCSLHSSSSLNRALG